MLRYVITAVFTAAAITVQAQVEIVESKPFGAPGSPSADQAAKGMDSQLQNELYFQLQILQQEVQELRGLVEQQSHELKRLKQQRLDDYLDLDRRLSQVSQSSPGDSASPSTAPRTSVADIDLTPSETSGADELASYRSAIDLVLKKRDFEGGAEALNRYLESYPRGHYAANSQYWLGQIYYQKEDMEQSRKWFGAMIEQFPKHQKVPEAKFKLAQVLHQLGETGQAKTLLQEVIASGTSASPLAQEFLKTLN